MDLAFRRLAQELRISPNRCQSIALVQNRDVFLSVTENKPAVVSITAGLFVCDFVFYKQNSGWEPRIIAKVLLVLPQGSLSGLVPVFVPQG